MSGLVGNLGVTVAVGTGTSSSSTPSTSTGTTAPTTTTPSTSTPTVSTPAAVRAGTSFKAWSLQAGETVYRSVRSCTGPVPWVPWTVAWVFSDGNGVLVGPGNEVCITRHLTVGYDVRRATELYPDDPYPGP